jgi:hypothetical protein
VDLGEATTLGSHHLLLLMAQSIAGPSPCTGMSGSIYTLRYSNLRNDEIFLSSPSLSLYSKPSSPMQRFAGISFSPIVCSQASDIYRAAATNTQRNFNDPHLSSHSRASSDSTGESEFLMDNNTVGPSYPPPSDHPISYSTTSAAPSFCANGCRESSLRPQSTMQESTPTNVDLQHPVLNINATFIHEECQL